MRGRSVLVLLVVFGVLLGVFLRGRGSKPVAGAREELLRVDENRVTGVLVKTNRDTVMLVRNQDGDWFLGGSSPDRADGPRVRTLLHLMNPLEVKERVSGSRSQQITYHLDRPLALVELREGSRGSVLAVGRKNPAFDAYYVMAGGDSARVGLVDAELVEGYLLAGKDAFRSKQVAEFRIEDVARVQVESPRGTVLLDRNEAGRWEIVRPAAGPANQPAVNGLLRQLASGRVASFVDETAPDLARYGLAKPALAVRIALQNGKALSLLVGDTVPSGDAFFATRSEDPRVFTLAGSSRRELDKNVEELRERALLGLDPDSVLAIEATRGSTRFRAEREGSTGWTVVEGTDPGPGALDALVVTVSRLEGRRFFDEPGAAARMGLDPPSFVVAVSMAAGKHHGLALSREGPDAFARWLPDGVPATIDPEAFDRLRALVEGPGRALERDR